MKKYDIGDGNHNETIDADDMASALEAAEVSWQNGDWGEGKALIDVRVVEVDEDGNEVGNAEYIEVEVGEDPPEPDCTSEEGHDWQYPFECVGGIKENPGVWSGGGTTMIYKECCARCGAYKKTVMFGSQRNPGQCDTVEYLDADDDSLKWSKQI